MRNHFIPIKMTIIKISDTNKVWWGCGEFGNFIPAGRNINWYRHFGKQSTVYKTVKCRVTIWPSHSIPRVIPKGNENMYQHKTCT